MKEQAGTQTLENGDVSELQMVGQLLFGSLPDASEDASEESPRMINLGSKIAPESTREWVSSDQTTEVPVSEELPPTVEPEATRASVKSERKSDRNLRHHISTVCTILMIVTLSGLLFVSGMMVNEKKSTSDDTEQTLAAETPAPAPAAVPSNPTDSFATREIPEFSQMPQSVESFEVSASNPVEEAEDFPTYNPTIASVSPTQPTFAPVNNAVGMNVSSAGEMVSTNPEEEECPVFDARSAMGSQAGSGLEIAANNDAIPTYNAGSTMDEIPVYNPLVGTQVVGTPVASTSYVPAMQPTYAPSAPAVGSQVSASAPRKLAPPAAAHYSETTYEEPVPSFDPGRGAQSVEIPAMYR